MTPNPGANASLLLQLREPRPAAPPTPPTGWSPWALGFRPFYLGAAVFAALSVLLWGLQVAGALPGAYLAGPLWHAHEMLFGFALPVVVGFLFTAGRNWTGRPTPTGPALAAIFALWLAARVLVLTPWSMAAAVAGVAFPLAAAFALGRVVVAARQMRNLVFVVALVGFGLLDGLVHAVLHGLLVASPLAVLQLGLDLLLLIVTIMAGRVLPLFTNNGVPLPPDRAARRVVLLERLAVGGAVAVLVLDASTTAGAPPSWWPDVARAGLFGALASVQVLRCAGWRPWATWRKPLVWVLHVACAWVPVHLALRAAAAIGAVPPSAATHALTVGAVGGLILGMMARTTRGHTGRPLTADRADTVAFVLVPVAALVRIGVPLVLPAWTVAAVLVSAVGWSAAFALFALRYAGPLMRPRLDGRPG